MPRRLRLASGGYAYHVLNRAVARERIFKKGEGLRGLRGGHRASQGPVADAGFGVVRHAHALALRPLAARRWRSIGVHAMVDGHAYPTLARGAPDLWNGGALSGAIQVVPDSRGRSFVYGAALCGTEPIAEIWCRMRLPGGGRVFGIACMAATPGLLTPVRCQCPRTGCTMCRHLKAKAS